MIDTLRNGERMWLFVAILFGIIKLSHETVYSCNASASCGCSMNPAVVTEIVGGQRARYATWDWTVSLEIDGGSLCGGSIISDSWIITAAHCFEKGAASNVSIYAGSRTRWKGSQSRIASRIIIHPNYDRITQANDIALLRMNTPLIMADRRVTKICLPPVGLGIIAANPWPPVGVPVVAVGWGHTVENGTVSDLLRQVTLRTFAYANRICRSEVRNTHLQFCAGVANGRKDTCQGDSGGPLMMFTAQRRWMLVGLTSYGEGCARVNHLGVYTRVTSFLRWIQRLTGISG